MLADGASDSSSLRRGVHVHGAQDFLDRWGVEGKSSVGIKFYSLFALMEYEQAMEWFDFSGVLQFASLSGILSKERGPALVWPITKQIQNELGSKVL